MKSSLKRDLMLEGLDCASCAAKIEERIRAIDGVTSAAVSFATKALRIEVKDGEDIEDILIEAAKIIHKLEPNVMVREKALKRTNQKVLILMGLACANCAARIESEVKNLAGVKSASVDFVSQKLIIEVYSRQDLKRVVEEAERIAKKIEADIQVLPEEERDASAEDMLAHKANRTEWVRLGTGAVLFISAMVLNLSYWPELILYLLSYLLVGGEVLLKAARNILRGQVFDENFLMGIATIGAFAVGEFPEGVAVMLFYQVGELFQDIAVNRSRKSITALMDIRPDFAHLKKGEDTIKVSPEEVNAGDTIVVLPGERIPLDGIIVDGKSMVDTSALTGESVPRTVEKDSEVLGGFINNNGVLTLQVTKEFGDSTVAKILDLVQNASSRKAPTENFITKFARYYTPIVVFSALAIAVIPPMVIRDALFSDWIYRALIVLVISCPCALVVSIPLGFFGGIGGASRNGILVKGGNYLEALNNVDTVVFDKTGTLTKGVFKVTRIRTDNHYTQDELLKLAASAESYSNHPIAASIQKAYGREVDRERILDYEEISGHGIKAVIDGKEILAGNAKLMGRENIDYSQVEGLGTIVYLAVDHQYAGSIEISDEIKEDSAQAVKAIKGLGIRQTVMLTGDNKAVGEKVGELIGLDEVHAGLLPDQKVEKLEMLDSQKKSKGKLLFVGDGINDAPVLARADIGVAMGGLGSDAAIEAADVVLMTDEPSKLVSAIKIARRTRKIVWQNIVFALAVKGIVLLMGAGGIATMWEAVFADVGVALIAVVNAMRVMNVKNI